MLQNPQVKTASPCKQCNWPTYSDNIKLLVLLSCLSHCLVKLLCVVRVGWLSMLITAGCMGILGEEHLVILAPPCLAPLGPYAMIAGPRDCAKENAGAMQQHEECLKYQLLDGNLWFGFSMGN